MIVTTEWGRWAGYYWRECHQAPKLMRQLGGKHPLGPAREDSGGPDSELLIFQSLENISCDITYPSRLGLLPRDSPIFPDREACRIPRRQS